MSRSGGNRRKNNDIEESNRNKASEEMQQSLGDNDNLLAITTNSTIPSSPPPSYEHVLEEARLEHSTPENEDEAEDAAGNNEAGRICESNGIANYNMAEPVENERIPTVVKGPEILHKSSKEFYRAVAKQWGITCKMSDHCRCLDCQSHYFDCEYERDNNEPDKSWQDQMAGSDGGLSAGTPMFISEVIHGTVCSLL